MIAQHTGECGACPHRVRRGERVVVVDGVWQHDKCPPPRVMFVCECGVQTPCPCRDNSLAELAHV